MTEIIIEIEIINSGRMVLNPFIESNRMYGVPTENEPIDGSTNILD